MGSREVIIRFCDCCKREIIGRLTLHTCPKCGADICVSCQLKENNKHKPRDSKPKTEQTSSEEKPTLGDGKIINGKPHRYVKAGKDIIVKEAPEIFDKKGDNLTIHVPTGLGGDTEYMVNIAGSEARGPALRLTVTEALLPDDGKIPDCLSEQERATIQGILDA